MDESERWLAIRIAWDRASEAAVELHHRIPGLIPGHGFGRVDKRFKVMIDFTGDQLFIWDPTAGADGSGDYVEAPSVRDSDREAIVSRAKAYVAAIVDCEGG